MTGGGGRLVFVGLGLHNEEGVTLQGLRELQAADVLYAEEYTSMLSEGSLDRLSKKTGKPIERLGREPLEDGKRILNECRRKNVALLVAGDPMTATTHVELRLRAIEQGSRTAVVFGVSVMTAVPGLLGLQHYKFGRTVTLPIPQEGYSPTSPYELIAENKARGLHTLVLLDIDAQNERYMSANEGLHLLLDMERRTSLHAISPDALVCVVARAGSPECIVRAGPLSEMIAIDFGGPLHTLVLPGTLHFMESEALRILAGAKE